MKNPTCVHIAKPLFPNGLTISGIKNLIGNRPTENVIFYVRPEWSEELILLINQMVKPKERWRVVIHEPNREAAEKRAQKATGFGLISEREINEALSHQVSL